MSSISSLVIRVFDEPRTNRRHVKRDEDGNPIRFESKGRVSRRKRG
jgi:hypothetical protein